MKSIEDPADADYGSRGLAAGVPRPFKRHDRLVSYALIDVIRAGTPEAFVARLVKEKAAHDQMIAMIPITFMGVL